MGIIFNTRSLMQLIIISIGNAAILRLPCKTYADFSIFEKDHRLPNREIVEYSDTDDIDCTIKCSRHPSCRSYNIHLNDRRCVLNNKALGDQGTSLTKDKGWVYKSTDYSNTRVGDVCQKLNPCESGILCKDTCTAPFYECIYCDEFHYGLHCDRRKDLDECASNPCLNRGTCEDLVANYRCLCVAGFIGKRCQTNRNECRSMPCLNGGSCRDEVNGYKCTCTGGYTGTHCNADLDECASQPCQNGGECIDGPNKFTCSCLTSFMGDRCEISK